MQSLLVMIGFLLSSSITVAKPCGIYHCDVGFYTYGGGTSSCHYVHNSGEPVYACDTSSAESSLKKRWESNCDSSFKCGCTANVMNCHQRPIE